MSEETRKKFFQTYPRVEQFLKEVGEGMTRKYEVKDKRMRGLHADRYLRKPERGEPLELRFAVKWAAQHERPHGPNGTLGDLLGDGAKSVEPTERDFVVAATVVQWLGSSVGQSFLSEVLGFDINDPKGEAYRLRMGHADHG